MSVPEPPAFAANAPPLEQWTVDQVCDGLARLGLDSLVPNFRDNAVSGQDLIALTDEDYEVSLKCTRLQVRKIRRAVEKIMGGAVAPEDQTSTAADDLTTAPSAPAYVPDDAPAAAAAPPAAAEPPPAGTAAAEEPYGIPPPLDSQPAGMAPPYAAAPPMPYGGPPAGYPGQVPAPYGQAPPPCGQAPPPYGGPPPMMPPPPPQGPYGYGAPQMQPYAMVAGPPVYVPFGAPPPNVYGAPPPGYSNANNNNGCSVQ